MNNREIQQYLSAYRKEAKESFIDNLIANPIQRSGRTYRPAAPAPSAAPTTALKARPVGDIGKQDWFTKYIAEPSVKQAPKGKTYTPSLGKKLNDATLTAKNYSKDTVQALVNAVKAHPRTAAAIGVGVPLVTAAAVGTKKHLDNKAAEAAEAERNKKMAIGAGAGVGAVGLAYLLYRAMKKKNRA